MYKKVTTPKPSKEMKKNSNKLVGVNLTKDTSRTCR